MRPRSRPSRPDRLVRGQDHSRWGQADRRRRKFRSRRGGGRRRSSGRRQGRAGHGRGPGRNSRRSIARRAHRRPARIGSPPRPRLNSSPGSHPLPDARSVAAGRAALDFAGRTGPGPPSDRRFFRRRVGPGLRAGAGHQLSKTKSGSPPRYWPAARRSARLNAVRKHLSALKGGQLAAAAAPCRGSSTFSSPTSPGTIPGRSLRVRDIPTRPRFRMAAEILSRFGIGKAEFPAVCARIEAGSRRADSGDAQTRRSVLRRRPHLRYRPQCRRLGSVRAGPPKTRASMRPSKSGAETGEARDAARPSMSVLADDGGVAIREEAVRSAGSRRRAHRPGAGERAGRAQPGIRPGFPSGAWPRASIPTGRLNGPRLARPQPGNGRDRRPDGCRRRLGRAGDVAARPLPGLGPGGVSR